MLVAAASLLGVYLAVFGLYLMLPGRWVEGYARDAATGTRLRYHLNGSRVFAAVIGAYLALAASGVLAWDFFYVHRFGLLASAFVVGLGFSFAIVLPGPRRAAWLSDFYLGRFDNPQWRGGRIDAKLYLYLAGATMLELCVLSFAAHHRIQHPIDPAPGVSLYAALFSFFLVDYVLFERVHLYTYDFVAERVGFKLGWGCLVFYPFFYCIGLWFAADRPNPHTPPIALALAALLFFAGWILARGANLQKYQFKVHPERDHFGPLAQRALASDDKRILISGFWGLSRHINYLGELLMASALALCLGDRCWLWPWLYPLYYVLLLVPRQFDDDRRCAAKYGALWDEYRRLVPKRIVPFIF